MGLEESLGGEDAEVGDGIAVACQVEEHTSLVADLLVGEIAFNQSAYQVLVVGQRIVLHIVDAFLSETVANLFQLNERSLELGVVRR